MSTSVLHVIPTLSRGGAGRALLTAATASAAVADVEHSVASLRAAEPWMAETARERGLDVQSAPEPARLRAAMEGADVVQVHFWNSPELYELLFGDLPEMRLLVWSHVAGERPPQVLVPGLIELADQVLASTTYTTELPGMGELETIPAVAGWERLEGIRRNGPHPFTIGYIGTLDFAKLHPSFVSMSAAMEIPGARFLVCGEGSALPALRRQAAEQGMEERIEFRGYVEDIRGAIAAMDVFGYPLCEANVVASELVLQEAMYAGVPPVVLASGGARRTVRHEETGLLAEDEDGYRRAIEELHADPDKRRRLGAAAQEHARREWSPEKVAVRWAEVYDGLLAHPRRARSWRSPPGTGAGRFVESLGAGAPEFAISMGRDEGDVPAADRRIAGMEPVLLTGGGSVLFYRDHYPEDGWLRLWAGLALGRQGRPAVAAGELSAAIERGCDEPRVRRYLARAALAASLRSEPCTIAYMGASVTVQKEGYRPRLHAMLESRLGHEHAMVNAGTEAIGAIGGLYLMDDLVLRHAPDLCFVEYSTTDSAGTTPPELLGPALEEIVCRLRRAGCEPCFLLLPRAEQDERVLGTYREVAAHHGVGCVDATGLSGEDVLYDVVHLTRAGAEMVAGAVAEELDSILDPTATPVGAPGRLFDRPFEGARLVPAEPRHLREATMGAARRFRLAYPCVEIGPGGCFECTFEEELVGMVVVVGPRSGFIRAGGREFALFDRWCWYERLSTVIFEPALAPGEPVTIELTDREVDHSICEKPLDPARIERSLTAIGFMVRPC